MPDLSTQSRHLPRRPGVYLFRAADDEVIYVGKANSLRDRVSSYFHSSIQLAPAKQIMIKEIRRLEYIIVRSETEALLLESTFIKKYRPKYNVLLKDDKYFQYIKISLGERFPSVTTVRRVTLDGSRYFGPYTSGLAVRRTMRLLKRLFPYKTCSNPPEVPCFDFQLKRCLGHDVGPGSQGRYQKVVKDLIYFLEGHTGDVLKKLQREMSAAAKHRDFEQAAIYRDRWQALHHVLERQTVVSPRGGNFDVISLARGDGLAAVNLFQVRQGKLVQRDQFMLQHTARQTDQAVTTAFLEQYYSQSTVHPPTVYVPTDVDSTIGRALQLKVTVPRRGLKRKLLQMGTENAQDYFQREQVRWLSDERRAELGLRQITAALKLPQSPQRIEMYDISNVQGRYAVGSMVVFEHGLPKNSAYRKFRIKTVRGPNDVQMMAEVLRRRFSRRGEDSWTKPNLILLDGGKPQLSVVTRTVTQLPRDVPIVALAKQQEELFLPRRASPLRLPADSPGLHLLQRIRDEAHRFAIGYYRKRHAGESTRSMLDEVPGLGPIMKKQLLKSFGTLQGIREAGDQEVEKILGAKLTKTLREYI
ncbi:MAG: excinuclease ABC subunit UvrC [Candidatus Kerfeldbacteria bacterium]|nr:excinuclease ABC subunit UvrC [Candidatus Kerfeldbacteria bacterium]